MIPLRKNDITCGRPLPWPVFDRDRHLLLRAGFVVESEAQLDELGRRGLYRASGAGLPAHRHEALDDVAAEIREDAWKSWKFEDLQLPLGTRLSVQKLDPDDDGRYAAALSGVFKDVSLIVNIPAPGGQLANFRQGQPLLLRAFSGTSVFAFTASVLVVRYAPTAYLHLEYPRSVDGTEVRARKRIKVRLIAVARQADVPLADRGTPAQVEDLSVGGARLVAKTSLGDPGTEISLAFRLKTANGEALLEARALIRATAATDDLAGVVHGVQFIGLAPLELLALEGFVTRAAADGSGNGNGNGNGNGSAGVRLNGFGKLNGHGAN